MTFYDAVQGLMAGKSIRRPHWKHGRVLIRIDWQGIPCAVEPGAGTRVNETYNFPLGDVVATDWEIVDLC